jgi:DNA topoisomerase I
MSNETAAPAVELDARRSARAARLRYVTDMTSGIRRVRQGKTFQYFTQRGRRIQEPAVLERIRGLVIPPAWQDVWICPYANGHIQACGFDARGRKQYRYHPAWQQVRDEQKYGKLVLFARALPTIRRRVARDLRRPGLPREKVLATVVRLLELTRMRVGNDEYARQNESYGLTTIHNGHAKVRGNVVRFDFQGKHQIQHEVEVENSELAKVVRRCQELPGHELFEYIDDSGQTRDVKSADVNEYLRQIAGREFSAKDFRTWAGTVAAAYELGRCEPCTSKAAAKRVISQAVGCVAERLGNTKAVCRKAYIHPAVIAAFLEETLHGTLHPRHKSPNKLRLPAHEAAVLRLLELHQKRLGRTKVTVKIKQKAG